jgi:hypothetical protein
MPFPKDAKSQKAIAGGLASLVLGILALSHRFILLLPVAVREAMGIGLMVLICIAMIFGTWWLVKATDA